MFFDFVFFFVRGRGFCGMGVVVVEIFWMMGNDVNQGPCFWGFVFDGIFLLVSIHTF